MSSSVAQDPSSRVVTRARIGFRARVTYFELGCPETNIDPLILAFGNIRESRCEVHSFNFFDILKRLKLVNTKMRMKRQV